MRQCWNWQTGTFEGRVLYDVWVQVPSTAPAGAFEKIESFFVYSKIIRGGMGLEEAVVNQAPVGPESGADRAAASRENPVPSTAPNQYNPNPIFQIGNGFGFFLIFHYDYFKKRQTEESFF